jgi:hypothetical protein
MAASVFAGPSPFADKSSRFVFTGPSPYRQSHLACVYRPIAVPTESSRSVFTGAEGADKSSRSVPRQGSFAPGIQTRHDVASDRLRTNKTSTLWSLLVHVYEVQRIVCTMCEKRGKGSCAWGLLHALLRLRSLQAVLGSFASISLEASFEVSHSSASLRARTFSVVVSMFRLTKYRDALGIFLVRNCVLSCIPLFAGVNWGLV